MWNFLVTHVEFLGYSCGISWLPMHIKKLAFMRPSELP